MEIDLAQECEIESDDLAVQLVPQFSPRDRFDVLLVADAPVDALVSEHRSASYSLVWSRVVESPGDPFASLDSAVLGSAHIVSGLSC